MSDQQLCELKVSHPTAARCLGVARALPRGGQLTTGAQQHDAHAGHVRQVLETTCWCPTRPLP
jgi:hypothetical protein